MDSVLPEWFWPIVTIGGLGAFCDFILGRAGQERARGFLEAWWIRFDDVQWRNFGRKEALFAVGVLDRWCGKSLLSVRRWALAITITMLFCILGYAYVTWRTSNIVFLDLPLPDQIDVFVSVLSVAASFSFTRIYSIIMARFLTDSIWKNVTGFVVLLVLLQISFAVWQPFVVGLRTLFVTISDLILADPSGITYRMLFAVIFQMAHEAKYQYSEVHLLDLLIRPPILHGLFDINRPGEGRYPVYFASYLCNYISMYIRISIVTVFVSSFIFKPLVVRPLSLIWLRIVESDKPIFTLIFGGLSTIAVFTYRILQHL